MNKRDIVPVMYVGGSQIYLKTSCPFCMKVHSFSLVQAQLFCRFSKQLFLHDIRQTEDYRELCLRYPYIIFVKLFRNNKKVIVNSEKKYEKSLLYFLDYCKKNFDCSISKPKEESIIVKGKVIQALQVEVTKNG